MMAGNNHREGRTVEHFAGFPSAGGQESLQVNRAYLRDAGEHFERN
jgi:hypothetical protein